MSIQTAKLIVSIVDQATGPARAINNAVGKLNRASQANARELRKVQGQMLGAAGAAYAVATAIAKPIQASREFQDVLTDLGDKGDLSTEQMAAFGDMAKRIAPDVNQFASEIVRGADFLVGMGLGLQDTADAMPAVSRAATGTRAELTDLSMAVFAVIDNLKVPAEETAAALDAMAYAGKEGGFELRDMAKDFPTMTATMRAFGSEGVPAVADLAAALQIVRSGAGSGAEAATNMNNLLQKIAAPATVRKFAEFGVDIRQELANAIEAGVSPIEMIVAQTNKALGGDLSLLGDLFEDAQVQKALRPLIQQFDEYLDLRDRTLQNSSGTINDSFARQMETDREIAKSAQVQMNLLAVSMGNALSPEVNRLTKLVIPMVKGLTDFATANPKLISSVASIVSGLVGLRLVTLSARFAFLFLRGGVLDVALAVTKGAGGIVKAGALIVGGFKNIRGAILGAQMLSAVGSGGIFSTLLASLGGVGTAIATAIGAITAPIWGLIALFVGAAFAIWKFWEPISNFFAGFGEVVGGALAEAGAAIAGFAYGKLLDVAEMFGIDQATVDVALETVKTVIGDGWNKVVTFITSLPAQIGNWLGDIFKMNDYSDEEEAGFKDAGRQFGQALVDGIKFIGQSIFDWFAQWPSMITNAIGTIDLSSIIKLPDIGQMASGIGGAVTGAFTSVFGGGPEIEARARGGPVSARSPYIVGEQGMEMFVPNASGYIVDALATSRMLTGSIPNIRSMPSPPAMSMANNDNAANSNGARSQIINIGDIILPTPTNADPQQIAYALGDEIARRVGGGFSDGGV